LLRARFASQAKAAPGRLVAGASPRRCRCAPWKVGATTCTTAKDAGATFGTRIGKLGLMAQIAWCRQNNGSILTVGRWGRQCETISRQVIAFD
jgi:hypothetical protein